MAEGRAPSPGEATSGGPSPTPEDAPEGAGAALGEVRATVERLRAALEPLRSRPHREIIASLGRAGARFSDDADPLRRRALAELPEAARLSPEMARVVLDGMARDWTTDRLEALVERELPGGVLDGFAPATSGRSLMAVGPALCVQIVSGSVPGVSVHALLRSLLVKAPTLLKPGAGDALLPRLFAEALAEEDPELASALEVVYWPGGSREVEEAVLEAAEVVVIYGSDETVEELRALARATTRVVAYHHRVGVGVVGRAVLGEEEAARATAAEVARSVALFEQRGCVCPQLVYVEEGAAVSPADFARLVAAALAELEAELPGPPSSVETGGSMAQLRGMAEMHAAAGTAELHHGGAEGSWTVIYETEPLGGLGGSPRTARIRPLADVRELGARLSGATATPSPEPSSSRSAPAALASGPARPRAALGPHLQSVGYAGLGDRLDEVAAALGRAGASRVVPFSALAVPPPWWMHDGQGPLRALVRWVELDDG
ncbi:MAG: acyl-CoA reductase [Longimicrobiales bacterium]|nr:acyl-CoA reductase [Longimicrobiales bacterium]